jgi:molybdopterin-containing oxidoreductase family membrane subunit
MGLVIPGMTPDTLGEIYEYFPSRNEILVSVGVFSFGALLFTLMVKVATPIMLGEFRRREPSGVQLPAGRAGSGGMSARGTVS